MIKWRGALPLAAIALAGCGGTLLTPSLEVPGHPGFDTWRYPGDDLMNNWRTSSPYQWVGFYLPAPCHRDESFAGKRAFLTGSNWGIAVLYVGQQTFDGQEPAELSESTICSSVLLTELQGAIDGRDAVARAAAEGFAPGTTVYLDIERMARITPGMVAYYQSWLRTVIADGRYRVGTYAHVANAAALYNVAQTLQQQAGIATSIPFWIAGGQGFSLRSVPEAVGARYARIWQGLLDVERSWGGRTLTVDENVATTPSPSAPVDP